MSAQLELFADTAGLAIIDMQEHLAEAMPEKVLKGTLRNLLNLIEAARVLHLPVAVSEQYPKGLGRSLPVVAESVLRLPRERVFFFEKVTFTCSANREFDAWIKQSRRRQWIVAGMETHVCVYQSVRALIEAGYDVHVPRDAVISRTLPNWETGLRLMDTAGAVISSTETVIFDLLKHAGTEEFRLLSRVVK